MNYTIVFYDISSLRYIRIVVPYNRSYRIVRNYTHIHFTNSLVSQTVTIVKILFETTVSADIMDYEIAYYYPH